ncbi:type I restriction endonuclease subunit R [Flammeovirga sp. OC4]|uniref:type I restriction endonuclease subunit R n=1 Tax=Flammeovirga sp. OC4 TaxID=1382345 RepID=UPI0005C4D6C7|nr:DEAD/DEAH box helicase family protein [Flammeovirga sp. OC4]
MKHNEDTRVKIPTLLHLTRLGYTYISLKDAKWDTSTNIFTDIFNESISRINPSLSPNEINKVYSDVAICLENEDLGKVFYEKLVDQSGFKLIDFKDFDNNSFHVVTELTHGNKDEDNFRPDITLLINGMPLCFIEVKKPNNLDGVQAEHKRMATRFQNKKFRKFINITQLMVFSNNMEYDDSSPLPLQGAFYSSTSYYKPIFNYFREEESFDLSSILSPLNEDVENLLLKDNNLVSIKNQKEYAVNKNPDKPTNRICTSLFQRERLKFILKYAIAYVKEKSGLQKHIMRYPQIFATKAIENKLEEGLKKGIIWHTQGSGKTALTYYNVKHLTDYFKNKGIVPKFYFIVDRLDLLIQASREFTARGLIVHKVNSKQEFASDIKSTSVIHNDQGKAEITVVNIQKFENDPNVVRNTDYNLNIQRIYFMDEVHRSYNPKGSFLSNLNESDANAIKIGLTGTPLLGDQYNSRSLFGEYIHKYYYNSSIADGYTLRLIREEVETNYKLKLQKTLEEIEILKGDADKRFVYAHQKFVEPMLEYIVEDFERSRISMNDNSIGGMVVCDSSDQAKMMFEIFQNNYAQPSNDPLSLNEAPFTYGKKKENERKVKSAILILHDVGTNQNRKDWVEEFKDGKHDFVFVYNMLLTGFDAPRMKKLYVGRVIKAHNLLQTLTRVNRTYKDFRFGYVVDFAGIEEQFKKTSQDYFNELQNELGDEISSYSDLFLTEEQIEERITEISDKLLHYDTENAENFSTQISEINDRGQMLEITKVLNDAKSLYNLIRLSGNFELLDQLDFNKLNVLAREANNRLAHINTKLALENDTDNTNLLNQALEDVVFTFTKISEEEMVLADKFRDDLQKTREILQDNFDQKDPEFISLKEELERIFKKKNLSEIDVSWIKENIEEINLIYDKAKELERKNQLLLAKYENDEKYARLHKRLIEKDPITESESKLLNALQSLKKEVDNQVLQNSNILDNDSYVEKMMMKIVLEKLYKEHQIKLDPSKTKRINHLLVNEYMNEYQGKTI